MAQPVALIAGPTASGKSDLAVDLALALEKAGRRGVVLNADSAQVYADLQVLSARPSTEEMRGVEHRMFGAWDGAQACSAADWAAAAKREIKDLHSECAVPILVGGTGLYLRTLLDGIAPIPPINPDIRDAVRQMAVEDAFAMLQAEDPTRAAQLNARDGQRVARALEVVRSTGKSLTHWQQQKTGGIGGSITLAPLILLPDREWLYERCDQRFTLMLERGALDEVERLMSRNLSPDLPVMRAIGVRELAAYLLGQVSRVEMVVSGQQATRNYAKRQYTWFRRQPPEGWPRKTVQNCNIDTYLASLLQH